MRLFALVFLAMNIFVSLNAADEFRTLDEEARKRLIDEVIPPISCCAKQEDLDALFYDGGPWDRTESACATSPIYTAAAPEQKENNLEKMFEYLSNPDNWPKRYTELLCTSLISARAQETSHEGTKS